MQGSSGSCCKRCITALDNTGTRRDGNINHIIGEGGRGGMMALVMRVKEEANVSRVGSRRGSNEVVGFSHDRVMGSDETGKGGKFLSNGTSSEGITDDITGSGFVEAAGKKVVAIGVQGAVVETAGGIGEKGGENGEAETAEDANLVVVSCGKVIVGILV
jgi:hypothetical protein